MLLRQFQLTQRAWTEHISWFSEKLDELQKRKGVQCTLTGASFVDDNNLEGKTIWLEFQHQLQHSK